MSRAWRKVCALPGRERVILASALVLLPLIHVALRVFGFGRVSRTLARLRPLAAAGTSPPEAAQILAAHSTARLVKIGAHHGLLGGNCLDQSVTLWWLLRLQHIDSTIRIGIRRHPQFAAHAWVELGALVINDRSDVAQSFVAFEGAILRRLPME